jgi:hypothetical protein
MTRPRRRIGPGRSRAGRTPIRAAAPPSKPSVPSTKPAESCFSRRSAAPGIASDPHRIDTTASPKSLTPLFKTWMSSVLLSVEGQLALWCRRLGPRGTTPGSGAILGAMPAPCRASSSWASFGPGTSLVAASRISGDLARPRAYAADRFAVAAAIVCRRESPGVAPGDLDLTGAQHWVERGGADRDHLLAHGQEIVCPQSAHLWPLQSRVLRLGAPFCANALRTRI